MQWNEKDIENVSMNLVGFNEEQSVVIKKVVMLITTKGITVYSIFMVMSADLAYNSILGMEISNENMKVLDLEKLDQAMRIG